MSFLFMTGCSGRSWQSFDYSIMNNFMSEIAATGNLRLHPIELYRALHHHFRQSIIQACKLHHNTGLQVAPSKIFSLNFKSPFPENNSNLTKIKHFLQLLPGHAYKLNKGTTRVGPDIWGLRNRAKGPKYFSQKGYFRHKRGYKNQIRRWCSGIL